MKKFLIGLLTGLALAILSFVIFAFSLARLGDRRPVIPDNATLVIRLSGEVPEKAPVSVPLPFVGTAEVATVRDLWMTLRKAAAVVLILAGILMLAGGSKKSALGNGKPSQISMADRAARDDVPQVE